MLPLAEDFSVQRQREFPAFIVEGEAVVVPAHYLDLNRGESYELKRGKLASSHKNKLFDLI